MFERFTDRARRVVVLAEQESKRLNHNYISTEHLLLGLIHENEGVAAKALQALGIELGPTRQQVEEIIATGQQSPSGHIPFTPRAKKVLELSLREALQLGHNYIGTEHLLLGLIREGEGVAAQVLVRQGADLNRVRQQVIQLLHGYQQPSVPQAQDLPVVGAVSQLGPVIARDSEIQHVVEVLISDPPASPLLVGERGVGISAVVRGVAQALTSGPNQARFAEARIREFDLAHLLRDRQPTLEQTGKLLDELRNTPDTIFFIDHARAPVRALGHGTRPTDVLRPILIGGQMQVIAAATPTEHDEWSANDQELYRLFRPVSVSELSEEVSAQVLTEIKNRYESRHRVTITDAAITAAVTLSAEQMPDQRLPGKAISLIERAAHRAAGRQVVNPGDLTRRIAEVQARKDAAIDAGDFQRASACRDEERALLAQEEAWRAAGSNPSAQRIRSVTAEDVAQAITELAAGRPAR